MLNRVVLVGRLVRDPDFKSLAGGKSVCNFTIAVTKQIKPKDGPDADFFAVTCWGQTADYVNSYLNKGRLVSVDGRLQSRKYEKDGATREVVEIIADNVNGLDRKPEQTTTSAGDDYDPFEK